jgi:hypothetical protein
MIGYHFTGDKLRDGRPIPPVNEWLEHDGPVEPCKSGLHASEHAFDALMYAPGNQLHRVELEGDLVSHGNPVDKWVGRRRRILASIDAESSLREFARWCASQVIHLWDAPQVVRDCLETGNESLRDAARDAAWCASRDASGDAACDAAWYAARDAACDAACDAAVSAACDAAWCAARAAACDAAWCASRAATWDASRDAAEDAARAAQRSKFAAMVDDFFAAKQTY